MTYMDGRGFHQPNVAVDAAARVPAGRVRRIVQANRDDIVRAEFHVGSEVQFKRGVAVRPAAHEATVEPDGCISHRAVDVQIELTSSLARRNREMFSIPTNTPPRKFAG